MLHEGQRLIIPKDLREQILWDKLEGVVVLGLAKDGQANTLQMSTVTINELVMLSAQLSAHVTCLLGHMKEV